MRAQKPTVVVVTMRVPLPVPETSADVAEQETALEEVLGDLLKKGTFPLSHARVESVEIDSAPVVTVGGEV